MGLKTFNEAATLNLSNDRFKLSCLEPNSDRKLVVFDCPAEEFNCDNVTAINGYVTACGFNECVRSASWIKYSCIPKTYRRAELRRRTKRGTERRSPNIDAKNKITIPATDVVTNLFSSDKVKADVPTNGEVQLITTASNIVASIASPSSNSGSISGEDVNIGQGANSGTTENLSTGPSISGSSLPVTTDSNSESSLVATPGSSISSSSTLDSSPSSSTSVSSSGPSSSTIPSTPKCSNTEFSRRCKVLSYNTVEHNKLSGYLINCVDPTAENQAVLYDCPSSMVNCQNIDQTISFAPGCAFVECNSIYMKIHCGNDTIKYKEPEHLKDKLELSGNNLASEKIPFNSAGQVSTLQRLEQQKEASIVKQDGASCMNSEFRNRCKLLAHTSVEDNHLPVSGFLVQCVEPNSISAITLYDCPSTFVSCKDIGGAWNYVPDCSFVACSTAGLIKFNCAPKTKTNISQTLIDIKNITFYYTEENSGPGTFRLKLKEDQPSDVSEDSNLEIMETIESTQDSSLVLSVPEQSGMISNYQNDVNQVRLPVLSPNPAKKPLVNRLTAPIREAISVVATNRPNNVIAHVVSSILSNDGKPSDSSITEVQDVSNSDLQDSSRAGYSLPVYPWNYAPSEFNV